MADAWIEFLYWIPRCDVHAYEADGWERDDPSMKISWHDVAEDVEKHAHRLAEDIFALEPDVTEEVDLKALFERILGKEVWTDKIRSEEQTSELQSPYEIVCRLLLARNDVVE